MTKLEQALNALYSGRCNLIQACNLANVNQETMKQFLLDKVRCSSAHPIQLTFNFKTNDHE